MNGHLGDQVAAFVDGQLDYPRRERALEHLSGCADCRAAVEQQRWVKTRVQTLPGTEPSADLLCALTQVSTGAARASGPPTVPPRSVTRPSEPPLQHRHVRPGRVRRGGLLLAGMGSLAGGFLGLAYVVGGATAAEENPVSPPVGQFSAEFAGSRQPLPFADPALESFPVIGNRAPAGGR